MPFFLYKINNFGGMAGLPISSVESSTKFINLKKKLSCIDIGFYMELPDDRAPCVALGEATDNAMPC